MFIFIDSITPLEGLGEAIFLQHRRCEIIRFLIRTHVKIGNNAL